MADPRIITPIQSKKTVAAANTPEALVAKSTAVQSVELVAQKDQNSANTGTIWVGWSSADGVCNRPMSPGDILPITAPFGQKLDLGAIYIDVATANDGVTFTAIP
jgi:hypothetical protein